MCGQNHLEHIFCQFYFCVRLRQRDIINISRKFIFQVSESAATVEHEAKVRSFLLLSLWWDAAVPKIIPKE